jgi:hypothetical protein
MIFGKQSNQFKMKKLILPLFSVTLISIFFIIYSCNKDSQVKIDPLVGKYIISSATISSPLVLGSDTLLQSGTDLTVPINAALLSSAACSNVINTRLELKDNGQIWYVCEGESKEKQNGTWEINDTRKELSLTLNMKQNGIDSTVPLKISDLIESTLKVSGTTTVPLPPDFFAAIGITLPSGIFVVQTSIHIEITRMP